MTPDRHGTKHTQAPAWLDDLDATAADRLSLMLQHMALGIHQLASRALDHQGALIGTGDRTAFYRATGRCDGLHEAHDYLMDLAQAVYDQRWAADR